MFRAVNRVLLKGALHTPFLPYRPRLPPVFVVRSSCPWPRPSAHVQSQAAEPGHLERRPRGESGTLTDTLQKKCRPCRGRLFIRVNHCSPKKWGALGVYLFIHFIHVIQYLMMYYRQCSEKSERRKHWNFKNRSEGNLTSND